jgi:NAD(P)-dependent dehydrogenase (short-subunit alcohol dehydrogenase family)
MDVTDEETIERARAQIATELGDEPLFGLVNNAGVPSGGAIEYLQLSELRRVLEINTIGVIAVTRAFLGDLRRSRGRIVMVSSISGRVALPFVGPYAASKHALEALSDALRREVFADGIRVSIIEPGPIDTPIWERLGELDLTAYRGTRYAAALEQLRADRIKSGAAALPPASVAEIVSKALRSRRPRARYVVLKTGDRMKLALFRRLPTRLGDRLVAGQLPD